MLTDQKDPPHNSQIASPGYITENQNSLKNLGNNMGTIASNKQKKVKVGLQYSSAGYNPKSSCFHLAARTEKHATSGSMSKHSLRDLVFQCPP